MFIVPSNKGVILRDPVTMRPIPEEGAEVQENSYWRRRLADGDAILVESTEDKKSKAKKKEEPSE